MSFFSVAGLTKRFGGLVAVNAVDLEIAENEIVALLGPNGAGKSTLFAAIAGFCRPEAGRVLFRGEDITGLAPEAICRRGIARTFQIVRPFADMTVLENVLVGAFVQGKKLGPAMVLATQTLSLTGLAAFRDVPASRLTIAGRKRLELARALATGPKLLLLDEVMAGLNPREIQEAVDLLLAIRGQGVTVLVVEHVMEAIMPVADRVVVLDGGSKIAEGPPAEVAKDPVVITAYLGEKYIAADN